MFWKKKVQPQSEQTSPQSVHPRAGKPVDRFEEASQQLASSLLAYSEAAWQRAKAAPDHDLIEAKKKVAAARRIVSEGRIAFALGRCIPEHVEHWHAWIKRDDFMKYVSFDAVDIVAFEEEKTDGNRKVSILVVEFRFNQSRYRFILRNQGMSYAPDTSDQLGEVELWNEDNLVAHFDVVQDLSKEYSHWEFADIKALKVGDWMKDIIDISIQIETRDAQRFQAFSTERTLSAAKNISLS